MVPVVGDYNYARFLEKIDQCIHNEGRSISWASRYYRSCSRLLSSEPSPGCDAAWPIYAESIYGDDTDGSFLANIENMVRSKLNLGEKLFYQNMFLPLKEFSSNLETLWQCLNEGEALDWYWNVNGEVRRLAMVLTRIEWYLKAIFGKNLDGLNDLEDLIGFSGELYAPSW